VRGGGARDDRLGGEKGWIPAVWRSHVRFYGPGPARKWRTLLWATLSADRDLGEPGCSYSLLHNL
jgi:hypothetical protein